MKASFFAAVAVVAVTFIGGPEPVAAIALQDQPSFEADGFDLAQMKTGTGTTGGTGKKT